MFILKIEEPTFEELRTMFNKMLNNVLSKMQDTENDESVMNIKMQITTEEAIDDYGEVFIKPTFKYEVSTEIKEKVKVSNAIYGQYQLLFNNEEGWYEMIDVPERQMKLANY